MKRSILQSKKSTFSRLRSPRTQASLGLICLSLVVAASCRLHRHSPPGDHAEADSLYDSGPLAGLLDEADEVALPRYLPIRSGPAAPSPADPSPSADSDMATLPSPEKPPLAEMLVPSCPAQTHDTEAPKRGLTLRLRLHSPVGEHVARLIIPLAPIDRRLMVHVGDQEFTYPLVGHEKEVFLNAACDQLASAPAATAVTATADMEKTLGTWAAALAPDCAVDFDQAAGGWSCQLPQADPKKALTTLKKIRTAMIRQWSRQPYLLSRRVAVAVAFGEALLDASPHRRLDTLCHIVEASLAAELPAVMSSSRWRAGLCTREDLPPSPHRLTLARFGLGKAVAEIEFLKKLFERSSRLGRLTVRIPKGQLPHRRLWVTLQPREEVNSALAKETARIWAHGERPSLPASCWHPLFGDSAPLMTLARQLALTGDLTGLSCMETLQNQSRKRTERYLAESIASETEFVISNGRSKLLRLPQGNYQYTIQTLPPNPDLWGTDSDPHGPVSKGTIAWDSRRPRPVIRTW